MWKRRGGSFPHFQLALSILSHLPPSTPSSSPASSPPWLSLPSFKDACGSLALCLSVSLVVTVVGWLVAGDSPGDRLWVFTPRRCRLCGPGLVTLRLFSTETGLSLLRFRPLLCFLSDTEDSHTQGCIYLGGTVVLSCILVLTTVTHCTLCP